MPHALVAPVLDPTVRRLCGRPYPGHPRGCPNVGRKPGCPPQAPLLGEVLDLSWPVWAVWNAFALGAHVARMRTAHPDWSERQLVCCLYWQPRARADLRGEMRAFAREHSYRRRLVACPEAAGVDVTATLASIGVHLEWPPRTVAYQVALVGAPLVAAPAPAAGEQLKLLGGAQ